MILPMPLMLDRLLVALQLRTFLADRFLQFGDALVQAANLFHDHPQLDLHDLVEGQCQYFGQLLFARQRFLRPDSARVRSEYC